MTWPALALRLLEMFAAPRVSLAQSIAVQVGNSARMQVVMGTRVGIPLRVDLSNASSPLNLASLTGTLACGCTRPAFDSLRANSATGFTQTANISAAATGSLLPADFGTTRLVASAPLATAWLTAAGSPGGTRVGFAASDAVADPQAA